MKSIMLSVQPQWLAKILNGEKTIEIRKTAPKELPCEVYLYCTKANNFKERLMRCLDGVWRVVSNSFGWVYSEDSIHFDGLVVAKFTLKEATELVFYGNGYQVIPHPCRTEEIARASCLDYKQLHAYLRGKKGYAWHIDNLVIFDKPMELNQFGNEKWRGMGFGYIPLTRAPQSWQYVEVIE